MGVPTWFGGMSVVASLFSDELDEEEADDGAAPVGALVSIDAAVVAFESVICKSGRQTGGGAGPSAHTSQPQKMNWTGARLTLSHDVLIQNPAFEKVEVSFRAN